VFYFLFDIDVKFGFLP